MWSGHVDALRSCHIQKELPLDVFDLPYVRELMRGSSVRDGHNEQPQSDVAEFARFDGKNLFD